MDMENINFLLFEYIKNEQWKEFKKYIKTLDDNFNFNIRNKYNKYLLHYVVLKNNIKLIKFLLNKKCKLDIIDEDKNTILYYPIKYNLYDTVKLLLEANKTSLGQSILDLKDKNGNTALYLSIIIKNIDLIKLLLEYESNPNTLNNNGNNGLILSVIYQLPEIVELLIDKIIDKNLINKSSESALHIAANLQDITICEILLKNGSDVNQYSQDINLSPSHYATLNDNFNLLQLFINYGANINSQNIYGETLMHYAIYYKYFNIANLILNNPTFNANLWNINHNYPFHILLKQYSNDPDKYKPMIRKFIMLTDLNFINTRKKSCLYYLCELGIWKEYIDVLENKKLNIYLYHENKYIFDLVDDLDKLVDLVAKSYINLLQKKPDLTKQLFKNKNPNVNSIKTQIFTKIKSRSITCEDVSYPHIFKIKPCNLKDNIALCTFTGNTLDVIIGYIYLLKTHKNCCVMFNINEKKNIFYFEFEWNDEKLTIFNNFHQLFNKCKKKKYIIIPLLIIMPHGNHANSLIYNVAENTVERFEPHGSEFISSRYNYNSTLLDEQLQLFFNKIDENITYFKPSDYIPKIGFQSSEEKYTYIGDPEGFCVVWNIFYVDMRLTYHMIEKKKLIKNLMKHIKQNDSMFKNIIRNYTTNVIKIRDEVLRSADLNINDWMNQNYTTQQTDIIYQQLVNLIVALD